MNPQMEEIIRLLGSNEIQDRKMALNQLWNWDEALDLDDCLLVLEKAGQIKPITDEEWDNPSDALVTAACIFIQDEMIPVIERNILHYSYSAANKVLSYLLLLGSEDAVTLYKKVFAELVFHARLVPAYDEMVKLGEHSESSRVALEAMLENEVHFHPWYIEYYHYHLANGLQKQFLKAEEFILDKDYIKEQLERFIDMYNEYDPDYRHTYVYEAWKSRYLHVRFFLKNYLTLYSSFCTNDELDELGFMLAWKDHFLKLHYIEIMWQRHLDIDFALIDEILKSNHGSIDAYALLRKHKPDLIPNDLSYQEYYVKEEASFDFYLNGGIDKFPDQIEIMGSFNTIDFYGDDLTYYILRFKSNDPAYESKGWMRMLVGAYVTKNIPTAFVAGGLEVVFTDYERWEEKGLAEHENDFRKWLAGQYENISEDEVFYNYAPKFDRKNNTKAIIAFAVFFALLWANEWFTLGLLGVPLWWFLKILQAKRLEKNIFIQLRGYYLDYFCFDDGTCVTLNGINHVKLEKRTLSRENRFLFLPMKTWHFIFYDEDDGEIFCIPRNYLEEEYFFPIFNQRTDHLATKPKLTWEQDIA